MQKPEDQPSSATRKAIAALKEQQELCQSRLEAMKLHRGALNKQFQTVQMAHLEAVAQLDKQIAVAERELEEGKAAISKLEGVGG